MALVDLSSKPGPVTVDMMAVDFGGTLPAILGGKDLRINRGGNRWSAVVTLPVMRLDDARRWAADLTLGVQNGVRWKLVQVALAAGAVGVPLVAGGSQTGYDLNVDGMAVGASWAKGQFVALVSSGVRYVHMLASAGDADGSGVATLSFTEPMRVVPADNDAIEFAPSIEGLINADAARLAINAMRLGEPAQFTISEMA